MSKNVITISAKQENLFLICEGSDDDYVGIPCLKLDVKFPPVVCSDKQDDNRVKSVKVMGMKKSYYLIMQRNSKFKVVDSINATSEFAATSSVPLDTIMTLMGVDDSAKFEMFKGLAALALTNFAYSLNTLYYKDCGIDFELKGGFTFNNRGDMLDQYIDMVMIYLDILLNNGKNYPVEDLSWYYAHEGRNITTGQYSDVYILPEIAHRMNLDKN